MSAAVREEGFYWVCYLGGWLPAMYEGGMQPGWYIAGYSSNFRERELQAIGPRLCPPDEQPGASADIHTLSQALTIAS